MVANSCHKCGAEASLICAGCGDVAYCSPGCQRLDWKDGGHKLICQGPPENRKLHDILLELFHAEWEWLEKISLRNKRRLGWWSNNLENIKREPLNHFSRAGEIALCFAGAAPCAYLQCHVWDKFGEIYHANVTGPWYTKHKAFLNELGFDVQLVAGDVYLSNFKCACTDRNCTNDISLGNGLLIRDTKSPMNSMLEKIFVERARNQVTFEDFLSCVGLFEPSTEASTENGVNPVYFFGHTSETLFGVPDLCCSPCLYFRSFSIHPDDAVALGNHFYKCRLALEKIGFSICLDARRQGVWSDNDIAKAWMAAVGNDFALFMELKQKKKLMINWKDLDDDRVTNILEIMQEMESWAEMGLLLN